MSNVPVIKNQGDKTPHFQDTLHLEPINGVNFTKREIDVIACILSGKSVKKIAQFLSISPRTVENHLHNIMLKLGCQSQEKIIEFIEKSDKFLLIRKHYLNLLIQSSFISELKTLSALVVNYNYACLLITNGDLTDNTAFVRQFMQDLQLAGFKVSVEHNKKEGPNFNRVYEFEFTHAIYFLTPAFIDKLNKLQTDNLNEYKETIRNISSIRTDKDSCLPALCVIIETSDSKVFLKELSAECLNFNDQENYYLFVFETLKKLLPSLNVDKNILDFKKNCKTFYDEVDIRESPKQDTSSVKWSANTAIRTITKSQLLTIISVCMFVLTLFSLNFYKSSESNQKNAINAPTLMMEQEKHIQYNTLTQNKRSSDDGLLLNLPARNSKFVGREKELKTINEFLNKYKFGVITQAISGLGGVGKTQLAINYAYSALEEKHYDTVLWIRAETSDSLNNSYIEFAKSLKIDIKGYKPTDIQHLIHEGLKNFNAKNILFVLDNAVPSKHIEDYLDNLSKDFSTPSKLHILLTSRSQQWHRDMLLLDAFTEQEAYTFIKKYLPNEKDDSIYNLARILHYFPLAINQAIIYIQAHTNIDTYIEIMKLNDKASETTNKYTNALWSTWSLSFSKLGKNAKTILIMSSYLDADEINLDYFKHLTLEERDSAIAELKNYSFITINDDKNSFKIHRLLQKIVREQEGTPFYLTKAIEMLDFSFAIYQNVNKDLCDSLIPHVISLSRHAIETPSLLCQGLALYIKLTMYSTYVQEDLRLSNERWSEILALATKHLSTEKGFSYLLANINTQVGFNNYLLGNSVRAEEILKQAINTYEKPLDPISTQIEALLKNLRWANQTAIEDNILSDYAFALSALANVELDLNKLSSSEENYVKALKTIDQCKEHDKASVYKAAYLSNILHLYTHAGSLEKADLVANELSQVHYEDASGLPKSYAFERIGELKISQGDYKSAKKLFEQALEIKTKIYAKNNYRIGKTFTRIGAILILMNEPAAALEYLEKAEKMYDKHFTKSNINYLYLYFLMYRSFEANQDYKNSTQYLKKIHDIILSSNNSNAHILISKQLPIVGEFSRFKVSPKDIAYLEQSLELINNIFGKETLHASKYHYLLGTSFQNALQKENASSHLNAALNIILDRNTADPSLEKQNSPNVSLIKEKLNSLARGKN